MSAKNISKKDIKTNIEVIWEVLTEISMEQDLDVLLKKVLKTACYLSGARAGRLYLLDPTQRFLVLSSEYFTASCQLSDHSKVNTSSKIPLYTNNKQNTTRVLAYTLFSGTSVRVDDTRVLGTFDFKERISFEKNTDFQTISLLAYPLFRNNEFSVGVVELLNAQHPHTSQVIPFEQKENKFLNSFFAQVAVIINNIRLFQENQHLSRVLYQSNQKLEKENQQLTQKIKQQFVSTQIIGHSPALSGVFTLIEKVANTHTTVLITGETGVGKELVAQELHKNSSRSKQRFIALNCAALPENLLESELFGYKKGAFTGATTDRVGLFERANKGTLFLDEIGDLPLSLQAKLLRVLQEGEIRPLGTNEVRQVDVRILAATHKNLKSAVKNQSFREDLYFRLNIFPIEVPALRERKQDLPLLIEFYVNKYAKTHQRSIKGLLPKTLDWLMQYDFPGNVRELCNIIERAVLLAGPDQYITPQELPVEISAQYESRSVIEVSLSGGGLKQALNRYEAELIQQTMSVYSGDRDQVADVLGISLRTLVDRIKKYDSCLI